MISLIVYSTFFVYLKLLLFLNFVFCELSVLNQFHIAYTGRICSSLLYYSAVSGSANNYPPLSMHAITDDSPEN